MEPVELESAFVHFMSDLQLHVPDGIVEVDLTLLQELGLLTCEEPQQDIADSLSHNFYVIESIDKLTLFNERFSVWIVPKLLNDHPSTYTLIALNEQQKPRLEMAFVTTGAYNHSTLVLQILERFLEQIDENEDEICKLKNRPN